MIFRLEEGGMVQGCLLVIIITQSPVHNRCWICSETWFAVLSPSKWKRVLGKIFMVENKLPLFL